MFLDTRAYGNFLCIFFSRKSVPFVCHVRRKVLCTIKFLMFNIFIYKREKKKDSHKQFCNAKMNKLVLIMNYYLHYGTGRFIKDKS